MSYIQFDKHQLTNLEFALRREVLQTNRRGAFSNTSLVCCNTRKYHGMLVCKQPNLDQDYHVLMSCMNEAIEQFDEPFNLGIQQFKGGHFFPKGLKYLREITFDATPKLRYGVGGVLFSKETLFASGNDNCMLIKYTLEEANYDARLIIRPLLAFRSVHRLSKANNDVNRSYEPIPNGINVCMYNGYTPLNIQFSKTVNYEHNPDWCNDVEYSRELERGYEGHEDLYVPGTFIVELKKGESVYCAISTDRLKQPNKTIPKYFSDESKSKIPRDSFDNWLRRAAQQFLVRNDKEIDLIAGYPWYDSRVRDAFIALPGLTLATGDTATYEAVLKTMMPRLEDVTSPSMDTPLWLFWTLQMYVKQTNTGVEVWKTYGNTLKNILDKYRDGTDNTTHMLSNGLLFGDAYGKALTWMDIVYEGRVITPRTGMPVEVNALWYNAIMFSLELATKAKDTKFVKAWSTIAQQIPQAFKDTFWSKEQGYLADCVNGDNKDFSVRSNQIIAVGLPYSPISDKIQQLVLEKTRRTLLTSRGLRTLTPDNKDYVPKYNGNVFQRDCAHHQGTVWVWPLMFFAEGYLKIYGASGIEYLKKLYQDFEPAITEYCIGTVGEIFDADPPHRPQGAESQATSVGALLWINHAIKAMTTSETLTIKKTKTKAKQ